MAPSTARRLRRILPIEIHSTAVEQLGFYSARGLKYTHHLKYQCTYNPGISTVTKWGCYRDALSIFDKIPKVATITFDFSHKGSTMRFIMYNYGRDVEYSFTSSTEALGRRKFFVTSFSEFRRILKEVPI
jgi:hypothetical protein